MFVWRNAILLGAIFVGVGLIYLWSQGSGSTMDRAGVIRTLFFELVVNYGIREVLGIRFGYQGLNPHEGKPPITPVP